MGARRMVWQGLASGNRCRTICIGSAGWSARTGGVFDAVSDQCDGDTADAGIANRGRPTFLVSWLVDFGLRADCSFPGFDAVNAEFATGGSDAGTGTGLRFAIAAHSGFDGENIPAVVAPTFLVAPVFTEPIEGKLTRRNIRDVGIQPGIDRDFADCRGQG